jgi:exodeoxyribonuclease VII large subunit
MEQPSAQRPFRDVYSVSRLNREAKQLLEGSFPPIWIEGELSNLARPASGHLYFSLKDAQTQIRCAFFRQHQRLQGLVLKDGMHVLARVRVSLYEGRGDFQLIVEYLEEAGEGALRRAFDVLKARLAAEGLFEVSRKRPLPRLPARIGVVTSPSGAVLHDIVITLRRRFPAIAVLLYPVAVQGQGAAEQICRAVKLAGERRDCDALIVARGGGSLEDLWAFNEEVVARAIFNCPVPVVSAIGHETDFTITDFVADARAPTPTAAAELLSPNQDEWWQAFAHHQTRLAQLVRNRLREAMQQTDLAATRLVHPKRQIEILGNRLEFLRHRLTAPMDRRVHQARQRLADVSRRLVQRSPHLRFSELSLQLDHFKKMLLGAVAHQRERAQERLRHAAQTLGALSPLSVLDRGFSLVTDSHGALVRRAAQVKPGGRVVARLSKGILECTVDKVREND